MTNEEYSATQAKLMVAAGFVAGLDLPAFLERIRHTKAVAPLLDPTLFMKGAAKLEQVERVAAAANALRAEVLRLREEMLNG